MSNKNWIGFKNEFQENPFRIVLITLVIIGILLGFVLLEIRYYDRKENKMFTIGLTVEYKYSGKSGENILYKYIVNNIEYEGHFYCSSRDNVIVPNGRYFVIFSSKNPENSEMLLLPQLPDNFLNPPKDGWKKLPIKTK